MSFYVPPRYRASWIGCARVWLAMSFLQHGEGDTWTSSNGQRVSGFCPAVWYVLNCWQDPDVERILSSLSLLPTPPSTQQYYLHIRLNNISNHQQMNISKKDRLIE